MVPLILALDASGAPRQWITWQEAVEYHVKDQVVWEMGDQEFTFRGGHSRMTGEQSSVTIRTILAVRGVPAAKVQNRLDKVPPVSSRTLFRRDRCICAYCGDKFHEHELTKDHIIPQSRKGSSTWMNLVAACHSCNRRKDAKTPEEAHMPLLYVPYIPNKNEFLILANRRILADQMDFLLEGVGKNSRLLT